VLRHALFCISMQINFGDDVDDIVDIVSSSIPSGKSIEHKATASLPFPQVASMTMSSYGRMTVFHSECANAVGVIVGLERYPMTPSLFLVVFGGDGGDDDDDDGCGVSLRCRVVVVSSHVVVVVEEIVEYSIESNVEPARMATASSSVLVPIISSSLISLLSSSPERRKLSAAFPSMSIFLPAYRSNPYLLSLLLLFVLVVPDIVRVAREMVIPNNDSVNRRDDAVLL